MGCLDRDTTSLGTRIPLVSFTNFFVIRYTYHLSYPDLQLIRADSLNDDT